MTRHLYPTRLTFFLILLIFSLPSFGDQPVGRPNGGGPSIEWVPSISGHERIELRVAGPDGEIYNRVFANGRIPAFRIQDLEERVLDGQYVYELRVVPKVAPAAAHALTKARELNDHAAVRKIMKEAGLDIETVQSGTFTVLNGSIVRPDLTEARDGTVAARHGGVTTNAVDGSEVRALDFFIADDAIVQGSLCVGFDCVNNENFGFDTIRLKENNLRIKFEDTSVGSFPTNDWQLTANDSASGGSSRFSIEDITGARVPLTISSGATTNSIFASSTGRIGFRTATPSLDLHITTANTPAHRFEQTAAGGFTAQTWDVAGNEANFFVRDVTGGSRLPFRIRPGAPTSSIDISATGKVGIGTASPSGNLHLFAATTSDTNLTIGNAITGPALNISYNGSSFGVGAAALNVPPNGSAVAPNPSLRLFTANAQRMIIDNEGFIGIGGSTNPASPIEFVNGAVIARLTAAGVWQDNSSRAAKENVVELSPDEAFRALDELTPVKYNYIVAPEDPKVGFIAEDVPEIVAVPERNGLSALDIVGVLTKVVKEQQKVIEELNERLARVEQASPR